MPNIVLPDGITPEMLDENYRIAMSEYAVAFRRAKKLDAVDKTKMWETLKGKFPAYQMLPDTNHVSYIKNNLLASIYTVGKSAMLIPTSEQDTEIVHLINCALDNIWATSHVHEYQMEAGERAALLNLGLTQVGWDNSVIQGKGSNTFAKGQVRLKNIDPLKFMRDPFSPDLETAQYCMTWEYLHKTVIKSHKGYTFNEAELKDNTTTTSDAGTTTDKVTSVPNGKPGYYKVIQHWVRVGNKIHEIHTIDNKYILMVKEDIKPSMFPFALLHCNLPAGDLIGTSEPAKIFANSLAYNIMSSIILTADYKNQRPPRFVNSQSGLNVNAFVKHGNDADSTFIVNGDATKSVHYHQFPVPSPTAINSLGTLNKDISNITGIDGRYTGRDTGSVTTTGGMESMLDQVTMIDAPKVLNYEKYCKRLTELIVYNYIKYGGVRKYLVKTQDKQKKWTTIEVPFDKLNADTVFSYELTVSSDLPKNKARVSAWADSMIEKQMQYGSEGMEVDLITPQEWLMLQGDNPIRELMTERMDLQRSLNWTEAVSEIVAMYGGLVEQGIDAEAAISAAAETMKGRMNPDPAQVAQVSQNMAGTGDAMFPGGPMMAPQGQPMM